MPDVGDYKRVEGTSSRLLKLGQVGHEVENYANLRRYRNKSSVPTVRFLLSNFILQDGFLNAYFRCVERFFKRLDPKIIGLKKEF